MKKVEGILRKAYLQFDNWTVQRDFVGKNVQLEIIKVEQNIDYKQHWDNEAWAQTQTKEQQGDGNEMTEEETAHLMDLNPLVRARGADGSDSDTDSVPDYDSDADSNDGWDDEPPRRCHDINYLMAALDGN